MVGVVTQITTTHLLAAISWNVGLEFLAKKAASESDSAIHQSRNFLASHFATLCLFPTHDSLLSGTGDISDYMYLLYLTSTNT